MALTPTPKREESFFCLKLAKNGAGDQSRTGVSALAMPCNNCYTTPASSPARNPPKADEGWFLFYVPQLRVELRWRDFQSRAFTTLATAAYLIVALDNPFIHPFILKNNSILQICIQNVPNGRLSFFCLLALLILMADL